MEALILLFVEFLVLPLLAITGAVLALAVEVIVLAGELAFWACDRIVRRRRQTAGPAHLPPARRRRWSRWIVAGALSSGVLLVVGVQLVNWFFLGPVVAWQMRGVEARTGIALTFQEAQGSLWTGRIELSDVIIRRPASETTQFDFTAQRLLIDLSSWELLRRNAVFEEVALEGVEGTFDRVGRADRLEPRRSFVIQKFSLYDSEIVVTDHTRESGIVRADLRVDALELSPLRSDWAVFDVLFRAQAQGGIDGHPFTISNRPDGNGHETRWRVEALPVALVAPYLGGPLAWIDGGRVDLDVYNHWQLGADGQIKMDWNLALRDLQAEVPADASRSTRLVAVPVVAFLNKHPVRLPLDFELELEQQQFRLAASPEATDLWFHVGEGLAGVLAEKTGQQKDAIKAAAAEKWAGFKEFLDRRKSDDP